MCNVYFRTFKASIHQIKYEYSFSASQRTLSFSNVKTKVLDCPGTLSICFRRIILNLTSNQTADTTGLQKMVQMVPNAP